MPKNCHATRIENKHGGGVPDVHMVWDGMPFWLELKVSNSQRIKVSPHQIAWHAAYWARGGSTFYLVKRAKDGDILLFGGDQGPAVLDLGCLAPCVLRVGSASGLFAALRPVLQARLSCALRPAP